MGTGVQDPPKVNNQRCRLVSTRQSSRLTLAHWLASSSEALTCSLVCAPPPQEYLELCAKLKETSSLSGISGLLGWDEVRHHAAGGDGRRAARLKMPACGAHGCPQSPLCTSPLPKTAPLLAGAAAPLPTLPYPYLSAAARRW